MAYMLVFLLAMGIELTFIAMKIPFGDLNVQKESQEAEAARMEKVVKKGSEVFVVDYPELYVLCDYRNPLHNYSFIYPRNIVKKIGSMDMSKVEQVIILTQNRFIASGFFERNGFRMTYRDSDAGLSVYKRTGS
jgi:hypothetical protein